MLHKCGEWYLRWFVEPNALVTFRDALVHLALKIWRNVRWRHFAESASQTKATKFATHCSFSTVSEIQYRDRTHPLQISDDFRFWKWISQSRRLSFKFRNWSIFRTLNSFSIDQILIKTLFVSSTVPPIFLSEIVSTRSSNNSRLFKESYFWFHPF